MAHQFEVLEHTADVRLKVRADCLEELFAGALRGMCHLIQEGGCEKAADSSLCEEFSISSVDHAALLVDFLSKVLVLISTNCALYCDVTIHELSGTFLRVSVKGFVTESDFDEDIKAVTYHENAVIRAENGDYISTIVFDI